VRCIFFRKYVSFWLCCLHRLTYLLSHFYLLAFMMNERKKKSQLAKKYGREDFVFPSVVASFSPSSAHCISFHLHIFLPLTHNSCHYGLVTKTVLIHSYLVLISLFSHEFTIFVYLVLWTQVLSVCISIPPPVSFIKPNQQDNG